MTIRLGAGTAAVLASARATALAVVLDSDGAGAHVSIYCTTAPAAGGDPGGAAAVIIALDYPCGTVSGARVMLSDTDYAQITASGTATWARIMTSAGAFVMDVDVGQTGQTYGHDVELWLPSATLLAGAFLNLAGAYFDC